MIKSTEAYAYKKQEQMALTLQPLNMILNKILTLDTMPLP